MPNLVLRPNTANRTFVIQHKALQMPVEPGVVELIITPTSKYTIDAKDFVTGTLPYQISSINFENLGEKVVAKVHIKTFIDLNKTLKVIEKNYKLIALSKENDDALNAWEDITKDEDKDMKYGGLFDFGDEYK